MKKGIVLLCVVVIISILLISFLLVRSKSSIGIPESVAIIQYETTNVNVKQKEVVVDSAENIAKIAEYIENLKPAYVDLTLLSDVEIRYSDSVSVSIQLSEEQYCHYINETKNVSFIAPMPDGMLELIIGILQENSKDEPVQ